MFSPSSKETDEDFDQVLFVLIPIGLIVTHYASYKFYEVNPQSIFKVGMLVWYGVACWLTVVYLCFDSGNITFADEFFVYFYNCAGQLISFTGIVDCGQFFWCHVQQKTIVETNLKCFYVYALCAITTLMLFLFIFIAQVDLFIYRILTLVVISTEIFGYIQVLRFGWTKFNKSSIIYFIVTCASRIGIATGCILRVVMGGSEHGQQGQQIGFIHSMSIMFTLGVVVVFVDEVKTFLNENLELDDDFDVKTQTSSKKVQIHDQLSE